MAFTPGTLSVIAQLIAGGARLFVYKSDDSAATITGAGYFTYAARYKLRTSDLIFVRPVTGSTDAAILVLDSIDVSGHGTATRYLDLDLNLAPIPIIESTPATALLTAGHVGADGGVAELDGDGFVAQSLAFRPQPRDFGVVGDGTTDDTAEWIAYAAFCLAEGLSISSDKPLLSLISDTITLVPVELTLPFFGNKFAAPIDLGNVVFRYTGTRDRVVIDIVPSGALIDACEIILPAVVAHGSVQWPKRLQENDTGIRLTKLSRCRVRERYVLGFTKGIEYTGSRYCDIYGGHLIDNKFGRVYNTAGADLNASFTNENSVWGGRLACSSLSNALGNAYGQVFTWDKVSSYRGHNANRFINVCFEMGQAAGATWRVPVLFDGVGTGAEFTNCRQESCKGPFAICDGGLVSGAGQVYATRSHFGTIFNISAGTVQELGVLQVNGAVGNIYDGPGSGQHHWHSGDLGKLLASGGTDAAAYLKGKEFFFLQGVAAPSRVTTSATAVVSHRSALMLANGTRVGVAVDTSVIKTFRFSFAAQDGFPGRPVFFAFDAAGVALAGTVTDSAASAEWLADSQVATWGTEGYVKAIPTVAPSGNSYVTSADTVAGRDVFVTVRAEVKTLYMMVGGGTNHAALQAMEIIGFSTMNAPGESYPTITGLKALRVFSPLDDPGDLALATAKPDVAGIHGYYSRGARVGNATAAATDPGGWVCVTAGWLAQAWVLSTAYTVPGRLVINDTGKVYQLVTAGTSASSGGPTGTGTAIADGTCVWNYIGVAAVFATEADLV